MRIMQESCNDSATENREVFGTVRSYDWKRIKRNNKLPHIGDKTNQQPGCWRSNPSLFDNPGANRSKAEDSEDQPVISLHNASTTAHKQVNE